MADDDKQPLIMCPGCGQRLPITTVQRSGGQRVLICPNCHTVQEWDVEVIGDEPPGQDVGED